MFEKEGGIPKLQKVGSMKLSKMSWYAEAIEFYSLEQRGQAQPLKNNPTP